MHELEKNKKGLEAQKLALNDPKTLVDYGALNHLQSRLGKGPLPQLTQQHIEAQLVLDTEARRLVQNSGSLPSILQLRHNISGRGDGRAAGSHL